MTVLASLRACFENDHGHCTGLNALSATQLHRSRPDRRSGGRYRGLAPRSHCRRLCRIGGIGQQQSVGAQAAFDVESELEGFVLTDTQLHVLDLGARQWVWVENRAGAPPDLGGVELSNTRLLM